ncbi:hypothetical protein D7Z26_23365 [Cohnella endophytica]|uniref:Flagellar protein FliT n=1 Tax=Cohnella endophytica TaxID=2419778 RepID=A0A494XGH1_9BACL|nr:flagellar protein FliT [Cohnella endophytica]RKP47249.1 hypothetical protein D7Z26_23365 [Cohnella endophytica]
MDDVIIRLEQLTDQFVSGLDQVQHEEVMAFIEEREQLVAEISDSKQLPSSLTLVQKQRIQAVLQLDNMILNRMNQLKNEASHELQKIQQSKMHHNVYDKAYAADSAFFDKKK